VFSSNGRVIKTLTRKTKRVFRRSAKHASEQLVEKANNAYLARNRIVSWMLAVAGLLFLAGLQYIWYQGIYKEQAFVNGGVYAEATLGKISTLNPLYASTSSEKAASRLIFSRLFSYDVTGNLKGDLAKSLKKSDNGKIYTVTLRSDAKWHDGKPVTVDDVVFTVQTIKDTRSRSLLRAGWSDITITKRDGKVQFTLPAAYPGFKDLLTFPVLPSHILGKIEPGQIYEDDFSSKPIGSGPFKFQLSQDLSGDDQIVHLVKNAEYYGGAAKLDRVQIHSTSSRGEIAKSLRSGEVSATADLTSTYRQSLSDDSIFLREASVNRGVYAFLNMSSPILKDKNVRLALQAGVDTGNVRISLGANTPALDMPVLESQIAIDIPTPVKVNRNEAVKKFEAAGLKKNKKGELIDAEGEQVKLRLVTIDDANYKKVASSLATEIEQLGIKINKVVFDTGDASKDFLQEILQPRNYDILVYEIDLGADPDTFAYWHSSQMGGNGLNLSNYSDALTDDILSSARTTDNQALRKAKYKAFVERWYKDAPAIGLYQVQMQYFYNKNVRTFSEDVRLVSALDRFTDVTYWAASKADVYKTP
jgi:peptide/nickel transport system substrate-binding protein